MTVATPAKSETPIVTILPVAVTIFLGFLCIGIPFAVLPNYVRDQLGYGDIWIGSLLGAQSLMTLVTRHYAGTRADLKGPKVVVLQGLWLSALSGLISVGSISLPPHAAFTLLFIARLVLGVGESFLITGALAWGVGLLDPSRAGRVMAWSGIAMYGAIAIAAPFSLFLERQFGFTEVIVATVIAPLLAGLLAFMTPGTLPVGKERLPFYKVVHKVWKAGVGLSLAAVGFAGLAGFAVLYFKHKGWENASLVMTTFGAAFIVARVFLSHAPDLYGGKRVAFVSAVIEGVGLLLVWAAPSPFVSFFGAALTGFGYSLVFPSFGVEAVSRVEPQHRGVALGAYVAFFDLALGVSGPLAGIVASNFGYSAVYLFGVAACAVSAMIAWKM